MATNDESPRIGVFICHCGINIGGVVNVPEVVEYAKTLPDVVHAEDNLYSCSSDGINRIKESIKKHNLNRVVVASCTPRTHETLFRDACEEAGVNKYLFEMANIRDQCSWVHVNEPERATEKAKLLVRMAVAKARLLRPQEEPEIGITPSTLVIGGGISGMTAALCLANQGFKVYIVEKKTDLGGTLKYLNKLYPTMQSASEVLKEITNRVWSSANIDVLTSTVVKDIKGFIGNFDATLKKESGGAVNLKVGTIIVATGADYFEPVGMYGYREHENVITQLQLEELLANSKLGKFENVVMIQCVGARQKDRSYCSRICCMTALKNANLIKETHPDTNIYILYQDLQTYGVEYEEYNREVREKGVKFIKYPPEKEPRPFLKNGGKLTVNVYNALTGLDIEIETDLVVLATPLVQHGDAKELSQILKVPIGTDGFFLEAHVKLRPLEFATDGIYVCGAARYPMDIKEAVSEAYGTAAKAAIPMQKGTVKGEGIYALVDADRCVGCGLCEELCEYGAPRLEQNENGLFTSRINEILCKGCGVCAVSCPSRAISMRHFRDGQITKQIEAALVEVSD